MFKQFVKKINEKLLELLTYIYSVIIVSLRDIYFINSFNVIIIYSSLLNSEKINDIINDLNSEKVIFDTFYKNMSFVLIMDDYKGKQNLDNIKDKIINYDERFLGFYYSRDDFIERYKYIQNKPIDNIIEFR